jgi:hypothetical protein
VNGASVTFIPCVDRISDRICSRGFLFSNRGFPMIHIHTHARVCVCVCGMVSEVDKGEGGGQRAGGVRDNE